MQCKVAEIAPDVFRLSTFHPEAGIEFNQFLVRDDEPFLMHTGMGRMFDVTLEGVASIIDPTALRWIGYSHFEPDECGALNQFLRIAPQAQAVASTVGVLVMLNDFAERPARALADDEVLTIGRHRMRFLATPHLPHGWDAGLFFEETRRTLFCSDLFFQPGKSEPVTESDLIGPVSDAIRMSREGPLAHDFPYTPYTDRTLQRLALLEPATLATMHGASYRGDGKAALGAFAGVVRELLGPASRDK
jgi:flavorubredoxin